MRITIVRHQCTSSANCASIAPQVFRLDEENISALIDPNGAPGEVILEAAETCPALAIIIDDDEGNRIYPPEFAR